MNTNEILTEIRQTRDDLAREAGYDLNRLFGHVQQCEREAAARGVCFSVPTQDQYPEQAAALLAEPGAKYSRQAGPTADSRRVTRRAFVFLGGWKPWDCVGEELGGRAPRRSGVLANAAKLPPHRTEWRRSPDRCYGPAHRLIAAFRDKTADSRSWPPGRRRAPCRSCSPAMPMASNSGGSWKSRLCN